MLGRSVDADVLAPLFPADAHQPCVAQPEQPAISGALSPCVNFRSKHARVLRPSIAFYTQKDRFPETCSLELLKESAAFLGARNSRKPVRLGSTLLRRRGVAKDQLGREEATVWRNHARKFAKQDSACRIEIENSVDDCNVDAAVRKW